MSFTQSHVRKLRAKRRPEHVRTGETGGLSLSYFEGRRVAAKANRIFGFDSRDRETVSNNCIWSKKVNSRSSAAYVTPRPG